MMTQEGAWLCYSTFWSWQLHDLACLFRAVVGQWKVWICHKSLPENIPTLHSLSPVLKQLIWKPVAKCLQHHIALVKYLWLCHLKIHCSHLEHCWNTWYSVAYLDTQHQHVESGYSYEHQFHCGHSLQGDLQCQCIACHPGRWAQFPDQTVQFQLQLLLQIKLIIQSHYTRIKTDNQNELKHKTPSQVYILLTFTCLIGAPSHCIYSSEARLFFRSLKRFCH